MLQSNFFCEYFTDGISKYAIFLQDYHSSIIDNILISFFFDFLQLLPCNQSCLWAALTFSFYHWSIRPDSLNIECFSVCNPRSHIIALGLSSLTCSMSYNFNSWIPHIIMIFKEKGFLPLLGFYISASLLVSLIIKSLSCSLLSSGIRSITITFSISSMVIPLFERMDLMSRFSMLLVSGLYV